MKKLLLLLIIPFLSFGQTPITDDNIHQAVGDWLADPIQAEDIYGHIIDWDVSLVTDMSYLFQSAISFNQDIGDWDVSSVANMEWMFFEANSFNQDIGDWDVSSVTDMSWMFFEANSFNQDIGDWDVSNVVNMWGMFYSADFFNGNVEYWNVGNVIYMSYMFRDASSFNQDIGDWDVIKVSDMAGMFFNATSFNQDIGNWNVGNVTNMGYMFRNATSFNQDVGNWNVSNVVYMGLMFHDITLSTNNYDALLCGWSKLNLIESISFSAGGSNYCSCDEARQNIIDNFNWNIIDSGPELYYDCEGNCLVDFDQDGMCDELDNCPEEYNPNQEDFNNDGIGDACDGVDLDENNSTKNLLMTIGLLGRETNNNKSFQLHIYDDGSVEKKYLIK